MPWIVDNGALALSTLGTTTSKGTKVLSLSGKVANGGLVEVPMGTTLRQVVFDIGGGTPPGHEFKAVKLGGPSGGCLPAALLDTGIDFEGLAAAGAVDVLGRHGRSGRHHLHGRPREVRGRVHGGGVAVASACRAEWAHSACTSSSTR